jgi:hypothetical protein
MSKKTRSNTIVMINSNSLLEGKAKYIVKS